MNIKIPPALKKGDTIGITCPAGYMDSTNIRKCVETLHKWGFQVMIGKTVGSGSKNYFSGTDEERRCEFQAMIDSDDIHAILCARGGYGVSRIIDTLDFSFFKKKPKWIIGFSDITVLHCHLHTAIKTASLHAPMAAAFEDVSKDDVYISSLKKALTGRMNSYSIIKHEYNREGTISGELIGGNLALIAHLIGSPSNLQTKNKILFMEDVGEYIYNVDRMLLQLKRSGMLKGLAGLIVGQFTDTKDTARPFGKSVLEVIAEAVKDYTYPVCFNFPVGHCKENVALKCGCEYELRVGKQKSFLKEKTAK